MVWNALIFFSKPKRGWGGGQKDTLAPFHLQMCGEMPPASPRLLHLCSSLMLLLLTEVYVHGTHSLNSTTFKFASKDYT